MIAQGDSERESREEIDDVSDVGDVRVVVGYPALVEAGQLFGAIQGNVDARSRSGYDIA